MNSFDRAKNLYPENMSQIFIAYLYMSVCYLCSLVGGINPFMGSQMKPVSPATNQQIVSQSEQNTFYLSISLWPQPLNLLMDLLAFKASQLTIKNLIMLWTGVRQAYILPSCLQLIRALFGAKNIQICPFNTYHQKNQA